MWTGSEFVHVGDFKNAKLYRISGDLDPTTEAKLLKDTYCPSCGAKGYHIVIDRVSLEQFNQMADIYTCIECFLTFAILK